MADILDLDLHHGDDMAIDEDGEEGTPALCNDNRLVF